MGRPTTSNTAMEGVRHIRLLHGSNGSHCCWRCSAARYVGCRLSCAKWMLAEWNGSPGLVSRSIRQQQSAPRPSFLPTLILFAFAQSPAPTKCPPPVAAVHLCCVGLPPSILILNCPDGLVNCKTKCIYIHFMIILPMLYSLGCLTR